MVQGWERAFIPHPSSALLSAFSPWERFPSLFKTVDSATPGKPFVKNDIKVRDEPLTMDVIVQGKAYVLNETRVRGEYWNYRIRNSWKIQTAEGHGVELRVGEESCFFNECCEELHTKIRFCPILNRWINQKPFHTASIQRQNTEHQSITNRRCINHWSLQRAPFKNIKHRIIPKSNTQSIIPKKILITSIQIQ